MTLLARGAGLRRMATAGLAKSAELEARENQTAAAIDQAKQAQEMNTLGTGAGFGAMYGMQKAGAAKAASAVTQEAAKTALADAAGAELLALEAGKSAAAVTEAGSAAIASAGTPVATAAPSAISSLATIAAPVAIGLGVAYLLNKLFD